MFTTTIKFKLPYNASSRFVVDEKVDALKDCVIPIIGGDERGRPTLCGSAVVLVYQDRNIFVTAEHVLSDNEDTPLHFFDKNGDPRQFEGEFCISKVHDLAAKLLIPKEADALSHIPFIKEFKLARAAAPGERFYASVVGYPATAAKIKSGLAIYTPMEIYSNSAVEARDGNISVSFNKKEGARSGNEHADPRDPYGKSGGAIFGLPFHGLQIHPTQQMTLVGVSTRWKRSGNLIQGTSTALLLQLLDQLISDAKQNP